MKIQDCVQVCVYTYAENWNTLLQNVCTSVNRELKIKCEERITLQNETNQLRVHRDEFSLRFHKEHRGCVLPCHGHRKETILTVSPHSHNHINILCKTGGNAGLWSTCGWYLKEFPFQTDTVIKTGWCTFSLLQIGIIRVFFLCREERTGRNRAAKGLFFSPPKALFSVSHFNHWSSKSVGFNFILRTFVFHL